MCAIIIFLAGLTGDPLSPGTPTGPSCPGGPYIEWRNKGREVKRRFIFDLQSILNLGESKQACKLTGGPRLPCGPGGPLGPMSP